MREQVVGGQNGDLGHLLQRRPVGTDVRVRANEDAKGPAEAAHRAGRLRPVVIKGERVACANNRRHRQKRLEPLAHVESVATKRRFQNLVEVSGLRRELTEVLPRPAAREQLLAVHTAEYVARIEELSAARGVDAGDGTTPF